jgi:peptidoglycan lytic transglycosylase
MRATALWLVVLLVLTGCATSRAGPRFDGSGMSGQASWYGHPHHGRRTTSGEVYDMNKLTAAHRTLPLGTRVLVTNVDNGRTVEVRINDRGPFRRSRILDLSYAAAQRLGAIGGGVVPVTLRILPSSGAD